MEKISLLKTNFGDHYLEKVYCEKIQKLNGGTIEMSSNKLKIRHGLEILDSAISFYERDTFTESWKGTFPDGTQFRIVKPNSSLIRLTGNTITIASMYHDGYAVHFKIFTI